MPTIQKITPCLWCNGTAEELANYYISIIPASRIIKTSRYGKGAPMPEGTALMVDFELSGQRFQALNGGVDFPYTEAISLSVSCEDQAELDHIWDKLCDGGKPVQCGWLKDKFGLSWQIVPKILGELMAKGTSEQSARVMGALMKMVKLDIAALQKAYEG